MTSEEVIDRFKEARIGHKEYLSDEALNMAIKALEQKPCEDAISLTKEAYSDLCLRASKADDLQRTLDMEKGAYNALVKNIQCEDAISRQAVFDIIDSNWKYEGMEQYIDELPSVTPQPKIGHWTEKESIPYLIHKEMGIPISECQKAYEVAIDYLRSQGKVSG